MNFEILKNCIDSQVGVDYPGMGISVWHKNKEIYRYDAGFCDDESKIPFPKDARFYIFSCTKPITCTAVMQLYEKGCFYLNQEISDFLPEFTTMMVEKTDNKGNKYIEEAKNKITIKHLLSMTSGLSYKLDSPETRKVINDTNGKCPTGEMVKAFAKRPLLFEPGTNWEYGLSHDVLGRLVEVLSGMSFGEYLQKNIFEPCGMEHTSFKYGGNMIPMYRDYNTPSQRKCPFPENEYIYGKDSEYESGGAGLVSTIDDYIKFASAMACKGVSYLKNRILSPLTIDVMRTDVLDDSYRSNFFCNDMGFGYGLGVRMVLKDNKCGILANPGAFGWDGAAGCYTLIDPSEELAIFIGKNLRPPKNYDSNYRIISAAMTSFYC